MVKEEEVCYDTDERKALLWSPSVIMSPPDAIFQNARLVKMEQVGCSKNTNLVF
jgi:hypothetical protein